MGLVSSMVNFASQLATNVSNEMLTRESWARDDNAVQRRAADLRAAGMNPILAAGSAAGNSAPIPKEAPQMNSDPLADVVSLVSGATGVANAVQDFQAQALAMDHSRQNQEMKVLDWMIDYQRKAKDLELANYLVSDYYPAMTDNYKAGAANYSANAEHLNWDNQFRRGLQEITGLSFPNNIPQESIMPLLAFQFGVNGLKKVGQDYGSAGFNFLDGLKDMLTPEGKKVLDKLKKNPAFGGEGYADPNIFPDVPQKAPTGN